MTVVGAPFSFEHRSEFHPEIAEELLRSVPAAPGVFALRGEREEAQPYLMRAADMRRRLRRLLLPPEQVAVPNGTATTISSDTLDTESPSAQKTVPTPLTTTPEPLFSKRLNLRSRIRWVEWTRTGSEFESTLLLYDATRAAFGPERARERLKLFAPYVVRLTVEHEHPRLYVTNRLSRRALGESFGPFPSRGAAERYTEAVNELFNLRRCHENLLVHPDHPGCIYGEMKRCLAPCKAAVDAAEYQAEAARVQAFLRTGGESLLAEVAAAREAASERMDFEQAAALHVRWEKVRSAAGLADELVRPLDELRALVLQEAAPLTEGERAGAAAVFLLEAGRLAGPERLSTLGVRAVREQTAVGSSLFAQPLMLTAVPLAEAATERAATTAFKTAPPPAEPTSLSPEDRARHVLTSLGRQACQFGEPEPGERADVLALFRRWYYRPEKGRAGEVFLPNPASGQDNGWPVRRLLNGAARVVLGPPTTLSPVDREAAREATKALKVRVLHPGQEGVERLVPVLPPRAKRQRKAVLPGEAVL